MSKTVALVIAEKVFRDEEYQAPKEILESAGIKVLTVSTTLGKAVGKLGLEVTPDLLLKDLNAAEIDALIFIGGGGSSQYFEDPLAHGVAREFYQRGKIIGAICIAPVILAKAGLLKDKRATVSPSGAGELKANGAIYHGNELESDGRIITGRDVDAAANFGKELLRMLTV